MTRVLLADADLKIRSAIALLLRHKLGVAEICEIADACQIDACLAQFQPDLVLVDWELPGLDVEHICSAIRRPDCMPVVIVMSIQAEDAPAALARGAHAFLHKRASGEAVLQLLRAFLPEH
jgi:two-component system, NarL family, response regulator DesR